MVDAPKNKIDTVANHAATVLLSRITIICLIPLSMWILTYFIDVLDNVVELSHSIDKRMAVTERVVELLPNLDARLAAMERVVDRLEYNHDVMVGDE